MPSTSMASAPSAGCCPTGTGAAATSRSTARGRSWCSSSGNAACFARRMKSRTKTTVDAIDLLKQDHDKVERAFKQFEKMDRHDADACRRLIRSVCEELKVHTALEEEVFYPALRQAIDDQ